MDSPCELREVGRVTFEGSLFGGKHVVVCLGRAGARWVWLEIDGERVRPRSYTAVLRMIAKRIAAGRSGG